MSSARARYRANAVGVGWSKTAVVGSFRPVADLSRFRNSTEPSESKPSSLNSWSAPTASAVVVPEHDGRVRTDDVEQFVFLFGRAHRRDPLSEIGRGFDCGSGLGGAPCSTDQTTEHRWQARNRRMGPDGGEVRSVPASRTVVPARAPHRTVRGRPPTTSG